jgi:hypothetical protein
MWALANARAPKCSHWGDAHPRARSGPADDDDYFTCCASAVEHVGQGREIGAVLACLPWGCVEGRGLALDAGSAPADDEGLFRASDVGCRG